MSSDPVSFDVKAYSEALVAAREELRPLIDEKNCGPILIRLAWHDAGTFDKENPEWPQCGGANGSIRYEAELAHGANAGLVNGVNLLKPFKEKYPIISWADLMQLASAVSVDMLSSGSCIIPMRYGRQDAYVPVEEGNLPAAVAPFPKTDPPESAAQHLRNIFHRMGFNDQEIVALSGAHTIGRAYKSRSGLVEEDVGSGTQFTSGNFCARADGKSCVGNPGGRSWTKKWLTFDNDYFKENERDLDLPTDKCLRKDPEFRTHFLRYRESNDVFLREYEKAHAKLSELGAKFSPAEGIFI